MTGVARAHGAQGLTWCPVIARERGWTGSDQSLMPANASGAL
jgi:hypothetical protein